MNKEGLYPIGMVCEQSGINPVTLRAWERRYGLFVPHRTPKGHRLYTQADIERIKKIQFFLGQGYAIRQVKGLLKSQGNNSQPMVSTVTNNLVFDLSRLEKGLNQMNHHAISQELGYLVSEYGPENFAKQVYPDMLSYFDQHLWPQHPWPEVAYQILLDVLSDRLKQLLMQAKKARNQQTVFIFGYRTGMISKRIIQGLLLANVIRAYGFQVGFVSNVQNIDSLIDIAKQHPNSGVIASVSPDSFYQGLLLNAFSVADQANLMAYSTQWFHKAEQCLPEDLSAIYPAIKHVLSRP